MNRDAMAADCYHVLWDELRVAQTEIAALKHDLSRHLSITSEQATEILGKDKEIAELRKRNENAGAVCNNILELVQPTKGSDELAFARAMAVRGAAEYATLLDGYAALEKEVERQSVLLKKAETALEKIAKQNLYEEMSETTREDADWLTGYETIVDLARAVLSELQLKKAI